VHAVLLPLQELEQAHHFLVVAAAVLVPQPLGD
jgi:hypothetical protein